MRIGFGYDSHRFLEQLSADKPLKLGGVTFPGEVGLKAHSDGDVVLHAVIDALLGAAALGDIGSHFPDSDDQWRDADSAELVRRVVRELTASGHVLGNLDLTIICERPKIGPRRDEIRRRLAELLALPLERISVKGKTNEQLDDIGAGLGIAVHAIALLER